MLVICRRSLNGSWWWDGIGGRIVLRGRREALESRRKGRRVALRNVHGSRLSAAMYEERNAADFVQIDVLIWEYTVVS
jgi:hypothetical protein